LDAVGGRPPHRYGSNADLSGISALGGKATIPTLGSHGPAQVRADSGAIFWGDIYMGGLSLWHGLILLIMLSVFAIPLLMIIKKAGYSRWFALLAFIPLVSLVALWVFAFSDWPALKRKAADAF